jgi:hypothetical protein
MMLQDIPERLLARMSGKGSAVLPLTIAGSFDGCRSHRGVSIALPAPSAREGEGC